MKNAFSAFYSWALFIIFLFGQITAFCVPFFQEQDWFAWCSVIGFGASYLLTPIAHELGHIVFAIKQNMQLVYTKFSFFSLRRENGKLSFCMASPFASEQTQVIPLKSGNMKERVLSYAKGGLLFSAIFATIIAVLAVIFNFVNPAVFYIFMGAFPYAVYLLLLNLPPFEYEKGKTDGLVVRGLKKAEQAEKTMLSAMEIFGQLAEGKTYAEMDKALFFDTPVIAEDEPTFAVMQDLKYRYYLDDGDFDKAADSLNRLAGISEYMTEQEVLSTLTELVFMHSINNDLERAKECYELCKTSFETAPLRVRAAYAFACGESERALEMIEKADKSLAFELAGVVRFEKGILEELKNHILAIKNADTQESV